MSAGTFFLGPYFFGNLISSGMQTRSIIGYGYKAMLEIYLIPELHKQNVINNDVVWMQDGASPHIVTRVPQMLQQNFGDRIIARNFAVLWPPNSSDLTSMDF